MAPGTSICQGRPSCRMTFRASRVGGKESGGGGNPPWAKLGALTQHFNNLDRDWETHYHSHYHAVAYRRVTVSRRALGSAP